MHTQPLAVWAKGDKAFNSCNIKGFLGVEVKAWHHILSGQNGCNMDVFNMNYEGNKRGPQKFEYNFMGPYFLANWTISFGWQFKISHSFSRVYNVILLLCFRL